MAVNSPTPDPTGDGPAERVRRQYRSRAERRREIAEAALQLLAEQGPHAWTTALLAERVGVAEATLFKHFDNKADILLTAVGRQQDRLQAWIGDFSSTTGGWDGARLFLEALIARAVADGGGPLVLLVHATRLPPELLERLGTTQALMAERVEAFFRDTPLEPVAQGVAQVGLAVVTRALLKWTAEGGTAHPLAEASQQFALLGRAFASADPAALRAPTE